MIRLRSLSRRVLRSSGRSSDVNKRALMDLISGDCEAEDAVTRSEPAQRAGRHMKRRTYCVYNQTRECFISLGVTPADTTLARLKGLIGRFELKFDDGVWVVPSQGIHTLGVLFPLDLMYLDSTNRVLHLMEHFPPFRIAPLRAQAASVLELPTHTIYSSQTQIGDQLLICAAEEMERHLRRGPVGQLNAQAK
jgi:uncharacterized protein